MLLQNSEPIIGLLRLNPALLTASVLYKAALQQAPTSTEGKMHVSQIIFPFAKLSGKM